MVRHVVEERARDFTNYMNTIKAVEAGLLFHMHQKVQEDTADNPGELPDYSQISGNDALQASLKGIVDNTYSADNELSPFNGVINQDAAGRNFYTNSLLTNLLFPHIGAVKSAIGEDGLVQKIGGYAQKTQNELAQRLLGIAASDIVAEHDLVSLQEHLKDTYAGINPTIVDSAEKDRLVPAIGLDLLRVTGYDDVTHKRIEDAILGRQG
ncbi:hypothetical protein HOL21_02540 [Candidatus Woesearchaeota archaeon]|nr:hypothetical protein [Candidatus Woesearchaeota archaeon]MBT5397069.1 hypothetical protein [Candidatus Woesearchaeota archaeon]MBT6367385.1 hypothetical protein [Candidatus Woesearchaeota archaeon]MBT7762469.1 hypothetical protein [Candidatus Woesearchaeota archaeon]